MITCAPTTAKRPRLRPGPCAGAAPAISSSCRRRCSMPTFVLAPVVVTLDPELHLLRPDARLALGRLRRISCASSPTGARSQIFWNTLRFAFFAVTFNVAVGLILARGAQPGHAELAALFLPARLLPAGDHRRPPSSRSSGAISTATTSASSTTSCACVGLPRCALADRQSQRAMMSIVIMDVWKNTGFFMIIFIAALQGVPKNIIDAALDGRHAWPGGSFCRIILPYISPVVFFCHRLCLDRRAAGLRVDRHPDPGRPRRHHALAVDPHRRGGLRQLRDRLCRRHLAWS